VAKATASVSLERITGDARVRVKDTVSIEKPLTIILNGRELVTVLCTPVNLDYLAVGYLFSEGLLHAREHLRKVTVDEKRGVARVETVDEPEPSEDYLSQRLITSGCGGGPSFYRATDVIQPIEFNPEVYVKAADIFSAMKDFQKRSDVFKETGGVHSAAVRYPDGELVFSEDIGRHNAVDKVYGECFLKELPLAGCALLTSGRISSEILIKTARREIALLASRSAPTDASVGLAERLGITLIGFVRGERMNVYSGPWRVI
jgi:FdhD protein